MASMEQIAIIGGGAAGLAAAITAAERVRQAGAECRLEVVVYEAADRVGRSILATGNGRCNFSNARLSRIGADEAGYRNAAFVQQALDALGAQWDQGLAFQFGNPVLAFFAAHGLAWREESEGRLYPLANKASVVLDALRSSAKVAGVEERCGCAIERIRFPRHEGDSLVLRAASERFHARAVIIACGGRIASSLLSDASPALLFRAQEPVLGPLACKEAVTAPLDNIRVKCAVSLGRDGATLAREEGEVLFRRYGISGIAAFNLSRWAQPGDGLLIDFLPHISDVDGFLAVRQSMLEAVYGAQLTPTALLRGMLLPQVSRAVCEQAGVRERQSLSAEGRASLGRVLKGFPLTVKGIGDAAQCQVTRGGIDVDAVDAATMAVRNHPAVFACGEALDVDGPCGGFNLHWAWASGMLAALGAVEGALG